MELNIAKISTDASKTVIVQIPPGQGFLFDIKTECKSNQTEVFGISASQLLAGNVLQFGDNLVRLEVMPSDAKPSILFIHEFEHLSENKQLDLLKICNERAAKNNSSGVVIMVHNEIPSRVKEESIFVTVAGKVYSDEVESVKKNNESISAIREKFYASHDNNNNLKS